MRDERGGTRVPNQDVTFELGFSQDSPGASTNLYGATLTSGADPNHTGTTTSDTHRITLLTGDDGKASVYLTLGIDSTQRAGSSPVLTDVGKYTIKAYLHDTPTTLPLTTAPLSSLDTETFYRVRSVGETAEAIIEKVSGDKERVDPDSGAHPSELRVRVLNRLRQIIRDEPVRFFATVGTVIGADNRGQKVDE